MKRKMLFFYTIFLTLSALTTLNAVQDKVVLVDNNTLSQLDMHRWYNENIHQLESVPAQAYVHHKIFKLTHDKDSEYIFIYGNKKFVSRQEAQLDAGDCCLGQLPGATLIADFLVHNQDLFVRNAQKVSHRAGQFIWDRLTPGLPLLLDSNLDVVTQNVDIASQTSGAVAIALGGTNSTSPLQNNCLMESVGGQIVEAPALQNGQIFIGATGMSPSPATISGTASQINITNGPGSITLSTPQNIDLLSTPTFVGIQFQPSGSSNYVTLQAPATVSSTYSVSLPGSAPTAGQVLQATSTSTTQWGNVSDALTLYVAVNGNDSTGNGSLTAPFASLKRALAVANAIASEYTPVKISVGPGIFVEDTSSGPLIINPVSGSGYINIVGTSSQTTLFTSYTPTQTFIYMPANGRLSDLAIFGIYEAPAVCADGTGNNSAFINAVAVGCQQGFLFQGGITTNYYLQGVATESCGVGVLVDDARVLMYNSSFDGALETTIIPANTGVIVTGPAGRMVAESCAFLYCGLCGLVENQGNATFIGGSFISSTSGVQAASQSTCIVNGSTFYSNTATNMIARDLGTTLQSTACNVDGNSLNNLPQGTGLLVTTSAQANIAVASLTNLINGIIIGQDGDDSTTQVLSVGVTIDNCAGSQIIQNGLAQLTYVDGALNRNFITISNPTNVTFNTTDASSGQATIIGQHSDVDQDLILVDTGVAQMPGLVYQSNYMDCKGIIYQNTNPAFSTMLGVQGQNSGATLSAVTASNAQPAKVMLFSNSGAFGGMSNMRGWLLNKNATNAQLAGEFYNNDLDGKPAIDQYTSFQFDGFNNILQFPAVTTTNLPTNTVAQLQWAGDTNLYRAQAGVLQTDNNFAIQGLATANSALYVDGNKQVAASVTSSSDLAQLAGITGGPIQPQLNNKVSKAGDVMTGVLTIPDGTVARPALSFNGFPNTGLAIIGNVFTLMTSGSSRLTVDANGVVGINSSNVSTVLNVGGDVSVVGDLTVTNTLTTNWLTIQNSPVFSTDGANKAYVDGVAQGLHVAAPCTALGDSNISLLSGAITIDGVSLVVGNRVLLIGQTSSVENGIWVVQSGSWTRPVDFATGNSAQAIYAFIQSGSTYGDTAYFCTTLDPNAVIDTDALTFVQFGNVQDVTGQNLGSGASVFAQKYGQTLQFKSLDAGQNIFISSSDTDITIDLPSALNISGKITAGTDIKGASISDGIALLTSGNLNLNNLISTATVTSSDGSAAYPSFNFASSPQTGISAQTPDTLVLSTAGVNNLQINSSGIIQIPAFTSPGIVHNDASGNLSSSLITSADISATAGIADTQLGIIHTAGKVANSATTATNNNNQNTIVMRDMNGNFSAGAVSASLQAPSGSVTSPSVAFANSLNAGLSSPVAGQLSISAGGAELLQLQAGGNIYVPGFVSNNGVVKSTSGILSSAPLYDADIAVGASIQDTKLATIQSANKVANSATSATSANSANTIVARDGSGNFVANTATFVATNNHLVLGSGNTVTINAATPAVSRTYTVPDTGTSTSTFMMVDGAQTMNGPLTCNQLSVTPGSFTVGSQTGVVTANSGLYGASVGNAGQRLATFGSTPTVGWYKSIEPSRESLFFDDFTGPLFDTQWYAGGSIGSVTAPSASATGMEIGVIQLGTAGAPDGSTVINKQLNGTVLGNGTCYVEWRVAVPTLSTSNQQFTFRCGLGDSSVGNGVPQANPTTGIWFEHSGTNISPTWIINCASAGNTTSIPTTQVIAQGVYYRLGLLVDAAADSVSYYINDVLVGVSSGTNPITTNIPTTVQPVGLFAHLIKSSGTTARTANLDYAMYQYVYTSQR